MNDNDDERYDYRGDRSRWGCLPQRRPPKGYGSSDERIREIICARLGLALGVTVVSGLAVAVHDGIVSFSGTLVDLPTKLYIDEIAERVTGVKDIHNYVTLLRSSAAGSAQ